MNIVSLITCIATGLSYVGVTKNGRLDDPANFSPLRYGFGPRFIEAVTDFGPDAFMIQILGCYETRAESCDAQREFIEHYKTLWPDGYNVSKGCEAHIERDAEWAVTHGLRILQSPMWRAANAAAANRRKQTDIWRQALTRRSRNVVWRKNLSITRMPYLHNRWHVKRGLVPEGITVEDCFFCQKIFAHKALSTHRYKELPLAEADQLFLNKVALETAEHERKEWETAKRAREVARTERAAAKSVQEAERFLRNEIARAAAQREKNERETAKRQREAAKRAREVAKQERLLRNKVPPMELSVTLQQDREEMVRRVNELFGKRQS